MPAPTLDGLFNVYDIMSTSRDPKTNTLTCQIGNAITGEVYSDNAQFWGPCGLAALPSNVAANPDDAAQCITLARSVGGDIVFATRDVRGQGTYGAKFGPGDTCIYANGPDGTGQPRVLLKGDTGAINLFTKQLNAPEGTGMGIFIDPQKDQISLLNSKGFGIIIDSQGIHLSTSGSSVRIFDSGFIQTKASKMQIFDCNVVVGDPSSVDGVTTSVLTGPTGLAAKPAFKLQVGLK